MPIKRARNLSPDRELFTPTEPALPTATHGQDDYQQLKRAVVDYLSQYGIGLVDYEGKWAVSYKGTRQFFYGAGDAFAYAVGLIGENE